MYTIEIDKTILSKVLEYISKGDMYETIAYILPITLDIKVLIILIGALTIVPVANRII